MKIRHDFPYTVECIPHQCIAMPDGIRLSARIWKPEHIDQPMPAILEYIPYRKRDGSAIRDSIFHPLFAGHGYISVRVDLRGSGDSEGVILGEYLEQELDDAVHVINWLAEQEWCNGNVGMMGKSWGGFNALQVAALQPEPLKAIITVCSTDDRYADDVHYKGGCVMTTDMAGWATTMAAWNARPPSPEIAGDDWLEIWKQRCEQTPHFLEQWLSHQTRDEFWKHGSVCEDFSAIQAATLIVGGWADPYSNAIPRMLDGLTCPHQALIGPWSHEYPQRAKPGPQIGFTQECLRWWDHWLKDSGNDVMDEPRVRAYIPDAHPPQANYEHLAGRWVGVSGIGPQHETAIQYQSLNLQEGSLQLSNHTDHSNALKIATHLSVGLAGGVFFPMGAAGDYATDQQQTDALSLCLDAAPNAKQAAILGVPILNIRLKADQPRAILAARLCAVAPSGQSRLVSWGVLNLCHRHSHEHPEAVISGEWMDIHLQLNACGFQLLSGWHWRLAISPAYTAHAWPSPENVTLTIDPERLDLILPELASDSLPEPQFAEPECAQPLSSEKIRPAQRSRTVSFDAVSNQWAMHDETDSGLKWLDDTIRHGDYSVDRVEVTEGDPLSTRTICKRIAETGGRNNHCDTEVETVMSCDKEHFHVSWTLKISHNRDVLLEQHGNFSVARQFV